MSGENLGIEFTETMRGYFSTEDKDDFEIGMKLGKEKDSKLEFTLTVSSDNLDEMLSSNEHKAKLNGTVLAPALSDDLLTVSDGVFQLFVDDKTSVETKKMNYRMKMVTKAGDNYFFYGYKTIHNDPGMDLWSDTTTLYVTLYEGESEEAPVLGKGILKILPKDFMKQMTTIEATGVEDPVEKLKGIAKFGRFFAGVLYEVYGGIFAKPSLFDPNAAPRVKRPLRVDAPEVHFFNTSDDVRLQLTRYQGGTKGPVMVSHGLGVSSKIFSIDTIDTNLLEYLYAAEYDVWLLDYRASIDLPSSNTQFTADDIATKDYPAAVDKICEVTGAETIQAVVHCYGATTFVMAMLAGLKRIRSVAISQIAVDIRVPLMGKLKTGLHVPSFLEILGIDSLTAYVDTESNWLEKLYDKALEFYPTELEERCNNPVCYRIAFMYAPLYEHDQLNEDTHDAMHEMFGVGNMASFEHLALMIREGHVVAADGEEVYAPHLDRLAIPITFIHGEENACFLPESTEITFEKLREKNGDMYKRYVIPDYGHIDCIFGKDAVKDVFPYILEQLEETL